MRSKAAATAAAPTVGMAGGLLVIAMIGFIYYVALLCSKVSMHHLQCMLTNHFKLIIPPSQFNISFPWFIYLSMAIYFCILQKSCTIMTLPHCPAKWQTFLNLEVSLIVVGFWICNAILSALPIGQLVEGQPLKDGRRLVYRLNGMFVSLPCWKHDTTLEI